MFDGTPASAYTFQRESFLAVEGEAAPWFRAQWEEGGDAPFEIAIERYRAAERAGIFRAFIVRCHGEYVGYAAFFVFPGMHAGATLGAASDAVWLRKDHRRPGIAKRLMAHAEAALRAEGVAVMNTQVSEARPGLGRLLEHMGHRLNSRTYVKVLNNA